MVATRNSFIDPSLSQYVAEHTSAPDELVVELREVTKERTGDRAVMQIGDDQALLFEILARAIRARLAVEIGTFTGTSSIALARGMGPEGRLYCLDISEEWTSIARQYWQRAGVAERIELRLGPALESLRDLDLSDIDLAFVDADKTSYLDYYEELIPRLRTGGLLLADNTLQDGGVIDPKDDSESVKAIRKFNDHVVGDSRVVSVLLPIADGVTIVEKR